MSPLFPFFPAFEALSFAEATVTQHPQPESWPGNLLDLYPICSLGSRSCTRRTRD